jgi:hypothetical protein
MVATNAAAAGVSGRRGCVTHTSCRVRRGDYCVTAQRSMLKLSSNGDARQHRTELALENQLQNRADRIDLDAGNKRHVRRS